jgi:hypothetical protein
MTKVLLCQVSRNGYPCKEYYVFKDAEAWRKWKEAKVGELLEHGFKIDSNRSHGCYATKGKGMNQQSVGYGLVDSVEYHE